MFCPRPKGTDKQGRPEYALWLHYEVILALASYIRILKVSDLRRKASIVPFTINYA